MMIVKSVLCSADSAVVPPVLDAILHLPTGVHITVQRTSLRLLGELREWIEKHPEYLGMLHFNNLSRLNDV